MTKSRTPIVFVGVAVFAFAITVWIVNPSQPDTLQLNEDVVPSNDPVRPEPADTHTVGEVPSSPPIETNLMIRMMAEREESLSDVELQQEARQLMISKVADIVSNVSIYGLDSIDDANVHVAAQFWGGDLHCHLETPDYTGFRAEMGAVRAIVVKSSHLEGGFEQRFTPEQRSAAALTLYSAPDKHWSNADVTSEFELIAAEFGITAEQLLKGELEIKRIKVPSAIPLQLAGKPDVPQVTANPGVDAFIEVALRDYLDPEFELMRVIFRTEEVSSADFHELPYRLSVVRLNNNNFSLVDPDLVELQSRFRKL